MNQPSIAIQFNFRNIRNLTPIFTFSFWHPLWINVHDKFLWSAEGGIPSGNDFISRQSVSWSLLSDCHPLWINVYDKFLWSAEGGIPSGNDFISRQSISWSLLSECEWPLNHYSRALRAVRCWILKMEILVYDRWKANKSDKVTLSNSY